MIDEQIKEHRYKLSNNNYLGPIYDKCKVTKVRQRNNMFL